jgi:hypothetical protein
MEFLGYVTHDALGGCEGVSGYDVARANKIVIEKLVPDGGDWMGLDPGQLQEAAVSVVMGRANDVATGVAKLGPKVIQETFQFRGFRLWLRKDVGAEIVAGLANYGVLDDGVLAQVDGEAERDSFDGWLKDALFKGAAALYEARGMGDQVAFADALDELDGDEVWSLYLEAKKVAGAQFLIEGSGNALDGEDGTAAALLPLLVDEVGKLALAPNMA